MGKTVLVVDDDSAVRRAFELALEDAPVTLCTASSGREGLDRIHRGNVDLVLLDLKMPGLNGVETLRRLREQGADGPVYLVTAFAEEFIEPLRCAAAEGLEFDLLRKPLDRDQIRAVVAAGLDESWG